MIFVIDDFLENPKSCRDFFKREKPDLIQEKNIIPGLRYYNPQTGVDHTGIGNLIAKKTTEIVGERLSAYHCGFHFLYSKFEEGGSHWDSGSRYAAVLYLNENPPKNSGTRIFDHRSNYNFEGQEQYEKSISKFLKSDQNFIDRFLYKRSMRKYDKQFGLGDDIENVFNRLVIYDANYVHKALKFFGNKIDNCRFTYFCFMR